MSWAKLDDRMDIDPDLLELHPDAFAFFIGTITYSARNLTDGFIKRCHAADILRFKGKRKINVPRAIKALVEGRFMTEEADGWRVRNYLKFNPSCIQVESERQRKADKQSNYRKRKSSSKEPDSQTEACVTGNVTEDKPVTFSVPDPDLSLSSNNRDPNAERDEQARPPSGAGSAPVQTSHDATGRESASDGRGQPQEPGPMPKPRAEAPEALAAFQRPPEGKPDGVDSLDLTAEHLASPQEVAMNYREVTEAGSTIGLKWELWGDEKTALHLLLPIRRHEFREAAKIMEKKAAKKCWNYLLSVIDGRRKKDGRRPEPEMDHGPVKAEMSEVSL